MRVCGVNTICISSVLPFKGRRAQQTFEHINHQLARLCEERRYDFLLNDNIQYEPNKPSTLHFMDGLHLNDRGRYRLMDNFKVYMDQHSWLPPLPQNAGKALPEVSIESGLSDDSHFLDNTGNAHNDDPNFAIEQNATQSVDHGKIIPEVPINSEELKNLLFIANINTRRTLNNFKKEFEEL